VSNRRKQEDAAELMRRALAALGVTPPAPANDDTIDEEALREKMHRVAEKLRRARNR
jgi:hypothetical protein